MREHVARVHQIVKDKLSYCTVARFRELLQGVFHDRLASGDRGTPWFMLPILTCEALGGDVERAYHVAAGVEIGRIAAGCLDEWQDRDTEGALWQAIGPEATVSLSTGMIALSLLTLGNLVDLGTEPALILALQREFELTLLQMSAGQHADLGDDLTLDDYEAVAGAKSGALLRLGCRAGAMVAGASPQVVETYGEFGYHLGILAQVWNDANGMAGIDGKNDSEHRRALPVLAALAVNHGLAETEHRPESPEWATGRLYSLLQISLLHQRASEALARCPAPGKLPLYLVEYDPRRLVAPGGQPGPRHEQDHEP